jgi:hypothetical protein
MAETCSLRIRVTNFVKLSLFYVRLKKCGLFNNKHNGMAAITNVCTSSCCNLVVIDLNS